LDGESGGAVARVASGGTTLRVERFVPAQGGRGVGVLLLHGADGLAPGGDVRDRGRSGGYRAAARALAGAGFHVFLPHYLDRTGETQAAFSRIGASLPVWGAALADVLDHAAGFPGLDPRRVGRVGVSLGAGLGLALAARDARVAALVDCFGFLPPGLAERPDLRLPPTLVLHGARDAIVPVANAHALAGLLARLGVPHEVQVYPDQAHGFTGGAEADAALRTAAFLRRHLAAAG
jgi:dienelactone hydrolase